MKLSNGATNTGKESVQYYLIVRVKRYGRFNMKGNKYIFYVHMLHMIRHIDMLHISNG